MTQLKKCSLENFVRRIQISEFADLSWMPKLYQKFVQEALVFSYELLPSFIFNPWAEHIALFLKQNKIKSAIILGAGAGGPIFRLQKYFCSHGLSVHFNLTDLVPNADLVRSSNELITYDPSPVDALDMIPNDPSQAIFMIGCLHHFDSAQVRTLLRNFQLQKNTVYILEVSTRNWLNVCSNFLFWLPTTLSAPFIRPFRLSRILFSWIIPIFPIMFVVDGVLSGLRTYSKNEFIALTTPDPQYEWQITDFSFIGGLFKLRSHIGLSKKRSE